MSGNVLMGYSGRYLLAVVLTLAGMAGRLTAGPMRGCPSMPTLDGTGMENDFCGGWYCNQGTYAAPYHRCLIRVPGHTSAYRRHIVARILFKKTIRCTIQVGANDNDKADHSSVTYLVSAASTVSTAVSGGTALSDGKDRTRELLQ